MKKAMLFSRQIILVVSILWLPIVHAHTLKSSKGLAELAVSEGHWIYRGRFLQRVGFQKGNWIWDEKCRWAGNLAFMLCSFSNNWNGKRVNSIVVDTYDAQRRSFWHFEIFDSGPSAKKPFVARMSIRGNRRVESWIYKKNGKSMHERIVYIFSDSDRVKVWFQRSATGQAWTTTAVGVGKKKE